MQKGCNAEGIQCKRELARRRKSSSSSQELCRWRFHGGLHSQKNGLQFCREVYRKEKAKKSANKHSVKETNLIGLNQLREERSEPYNRANSESMSSPLSCQVISLIAISSRTVLVL